MNDLRLHDGLSMEEWQRRRREGLYSTITTQTPAEMPRVVWEGDPRPVKAVAARQSQADAHQAARAGGQRIDPRQTDVFRPGPDGKLHPIPGWRTTGPFDHQAWSHNVDWGGVGDDLATAAFRIAGLVAPINPKPPGSPLPRNKIEGVGVIGTLYDMGKELREDLRKTEVRPKR